MGIMTKDEYVESIRKLKPTAYMFGEKIESVVDNPRLRAGIEATGGHVRNRRDGRVQGHRDHAQFADRRAHQSLQ